MSAPHTVIRIRAGHDGWVDVWSLANAVQDVERVHGLLCAQERQRAEKYRHPQARNAFVVGRALLRLVLGEYTGVGPREVKFTLGTYGKVELRRQTGPAIHFSLAHADGLTLIALSRSSRVGIDAERLRHVPEAGQILARFASPDEYGAWRQLPPEGQQRAFFRWWTRKEAYLKATGEGLLRHLGAFDVPFSPAEDVGLRVVGSVEDDATRWALVELAPANGYIATVAIEELMPAHDARLWQRPHPSSRVDTDIAGASCRPRACSFA